MYSYESGAASNAVDGNVNAFYDEGSCTHTKTEKSPWWRVDLESASKVVKVF